MPVPSTPRTNNLNAEWLQTLAKLSLYTMLAGGVGQGIKGFYDLYKPLPDVGLDDEAPPAKVLISKNRHAPAGPKYASSYNLRLMEDIKRQNEEEKARRELLSLRKQPAKKRSPAAEKVAALVEAIKIARPGIEKALPEMTKAADDNFWDKMMGGMFGPFGREYLSWPKGAMPWWALAALPPAAMLSMEAGRGISRNIFGKLRKKRLKSLVNAKRQEYEDALGETYLRPKAASEKKAGWLPSPGDAFKLSMLAAALLKGWSHYLGPAAVLGGSTLATLGLTRPWEAHSESDSVPIKDYREALRSRMHRDYDPLTLQVQESNKVF